MSGSGGERVEGGVVFPVVEGAADGEGAGGSGEGERGIALDEESEEEEGESKEGEEEEFAYAGHEGRVAQMTLYCKANVRENKPTR